jgi:hypothetical protein
MGIRKVSLGLAAAALLGVSPAMAATPVTPSVAQLSLAPAGYSMGAGARMGAAKGHGSSSLAGGGLVIAVLAAAAVAGGVVAATDSGHHHGHSVSP